MRPTRTRARPSQVTRASRRFKGEAAAAGRIVRNLRHERGWTLEQASARMELDLKHLQKIEAGSINVTLVTLVRIADGLGVRVRDLFP